MLRKLESSWNSWSSKDLVSGSKLILPGVGAFDNGWILKKKIALNRLNQLVLVEKNKILGICLGMQLMAKSSEEGQSKGLSWIEASVKKFV